MKEGDIIEKDGKKYLCIKEDLVAEIDRFENGKPVLKTEIITKEDGVDDQGNPKRSVEVKVSCLKVGVAVGENK